MVGDVILDFILYRTKVVVSQDIYQILWQKQHVEWLQQSCGDQMLSDDICSFWINKRSSKNIFKAVIVIT